MERLLAQRDDEGLTFRELSALSGIPVPTLSSWAIRLRREENGPALVPVDVVDHPGRASVEIEVCAGLRITIERGYDADILTRVLSSLLNGC